MSLAPCPCGKVPEGLRVSGFTKDVVYFTGDCCEEWHVQVERVKNGALRLMRDALGEWDNLPRAKGEE